MNRGIGIDPDVVSAPMFLAQNLYTISAIETIEEYENRVRVEEVTFESDGVNGNIIPKVVLAYNGE